uniref:PHD-type domain-containing protein n=1 Tax=Cacopsylla melanoneura TaxID=428564 RepID=A0A8D8TCF1_9HEMI
MDVEEWQSEAGPSTPLNNGSNVPLHQGTETSTKTSGSDSVAKPEDIVPLPKLIVRRKRTGRGLKSTLLTSTPNVDRLQVEKEAKISKVTNQGKCIKKSRTLFDKIKEIKVENAKKAPKKVENAKKETKKTKDLCVRCNCEMKHKENLLSCSDCGNKYHKNCLPRNYEYLVDDADDGFELVCPKCKEKMERDDSDIRNESNE